MTLEAGWGRTGQPDPQAHRVNFPYQSSLETVEEERKFELVRLAMFALKLRKLEEGVHQEDYEFCSNLLRHVIFQQVVKLARLNANEQALQIIRASRTAT
jgi:hypothetical protein